MSDLRKWFDENILEYAHDIANHGADGGYPHITYNSDCVEIFDKHGDEIWDMAVDMSDDMGYKNVAEMLSGFGRADMFQTLDTFKTIMVWFVCEELSRQVEESEAA